MAATKKLHECPRNIPGIDMEVYTRDKGKGGTWYMQGHIVFYCPYCGVDLKSIDPTESLNEACVMEAEPRVKR